MHIYCVRKGKYFTTQITLKNTNIMKQNKLVYQAPEAEICVVKNEGVIWASPTHSRKGTEYMTEESEEDF